MASVDERGGHPRSTARIAGHPIHPMLIPFPIVERESQRVVGILSRHDLLKARSVRRKVEQVRERAA
jgi:CBS domain-containing protein